jgi:hypothetical protein
VRSVPYTRRRRAHISWLSFKTKVDEFSGLGLKTDSCGLVIWTSKSPRRFFGLGLKTKRTVICRLRHKTDGRRMARNTRRDLTTCFAWNQVGLGFPRLPQNWRRSNSGWCTCHHRRGRVKMKLKTDRSMRWAAILLPQLYHFCSTRSRGILVF